MSDDGTCAVEAASMARTWRIGVKESTSAPMTRTTSAMPIVPATNFARERTPRGAGASSARSSAGRASRARGVARSVSCDRGSSSPLLLARARRVAFSLASLETNGAFEGVRACRALVAFGAWPFGAFDFGAVAPCGFGGFGDFGCFALGGFGAFGAFGALDCAGLVAAELRAPDPERPDCLGVAFLLATIVRLYASSRSSRRSRSSGPTIVTSPAPIVMKRSPGCSFSTSTSASRRRSGW